MCSTNSPCPSAYCFSFLQTKHFCKAPTRSSHRKLILGYLLIAGLRPRGSEYAGLSALVQGPNIFSFLQTRHFSKTPTSSSHQKLILGYVPTRTQEFGGLKCARLSAHVQGPTISFSYN